ncbi:hypothetical protein JIG36_43490 [Actinoplanes sp. LDG1-06]|uniref:Uncharacterized protein n=1 Tax=Paractinoplanes ovalisporus TaxID=2810368 RepID=A0ABS2ASP1_9ACTN|nr:hypothetical protein [Actinoplanes ovalisporus]MBM2622388.1 hypothetical protein [Actinoplanes ovalisporus]
MTGDGLGRGLSDMWRSVLLFVPTALAFVAVLLIGWLVARLLRTAVTKGLHKAGLDRVVERGAAARAFTRVSPGVLAGKLTFYGVLLFALQLAFGLWGPNPVSDLLTRLIAWLPRLFVAIVLVVVAAAIARAVQDLIAGALGGLPYGRLAARIASVVIVALGVIAALDQVGIATAITQPVLIAVLATVAGVLIVGVGGGLVRPMQRRWETWLDRAAAESSVIRDHARAYTAERSPDPVPEAVAPPTAPAETQVIPRTEEGGDVAADETQVIPPPRQAGHKSEPALEAGTTGTTDTTVIGSTSEDAESTQVIPPADHPEKRK